MVLSRSCEYTNALALTALLIEIRLAVAQQDAPRALNCAWVAEDLLAQAISDEAAEHPELRFLVLVAKAAAQSLVGEIDHAAVTFVEAAAGAPPGCEHVQVDCLQQLALIEAHLGRLTRAETLASEADDLANRCSIGPKRRTRVAELARAWVAVERYDLEKAGRHMRAVQVDDAWQADGLVAAGYAIVKSRRLRARGEFHGAMTVLHDAAVSSAGQAHPVWLAREIALDQARLLITTGHPDAAGPMLQEVHDPVGDDAAVVQAAALLAGGESERAVGILTPIAEATGTRSPVAVDAWLLLALVAAGTGHVDRARDALRQALRLAGTERQCRTVKQVWPQLRNVVQADGDLVERYRALARYDGHTGTPPSRAASSEPDKLIIVEPLSKRELDVLNGLAGMLRTEEIAASMYVSVNTVKTHVRSILRKLSASRRNEAVRRARALGVI
jgi:LuxR family maltose regulon positive regulatory protein